MPEKLISDKRKFIFPLAVFLIIAASAALWLPKYGGGAVDVEYRQIAINMFEGKGFSLGDGGERTMVREPFYPFSLFLNYKIFGVHNYLIYFEQFLLLLLTCFFTYKLAVRFLGGTAAKIAVLAVAIHPLFVIYAADMSSEMAAAFLVTFSCFFFVKSLEEEKLRFSLLAGAGLGLLVLTKTIFVFVPFFLAFFYFFRPSDKKLAKILLFLFSFLILILPWVYRNHVYFNKWGITERGGWVAYIHASKSELSIRQLKNDVITSFLSQYFVRLKDPSFDIFNIDTLPLNQQAKRLEEAGHFSYREIDDWMGNETISLWRRHPLKNFLLGFLEIVKANSPTVPKDPIMQVYSVPASAFLKVMRAAVIIAIRLFWLAVLCFTGFGIYKAVRKRIYHLWPLIIFIFYINGVLFFLNGAPRYIFPFYALYFIFFALGAHCLGSKLRIFKIRDINIK